jgi:hypothetical protein
VADENQERESSESPMLNAFCRVAPSVLRNFLAILAAAVFFFAKVFNSRTSVAVQARRFFDFLAISPPFQEKQLYPIYEAKENTTDEVISTAVQSIDKRDGLATSIVRLFLATYWPGSKSNFGWLNGRC